MWPKQTKVGIAMKEDSRLVFTDKNTYSMKDIQGNIGKKELAAASDEV